MADNVRKTGNGVRLISWNTKGMNNTVKMDKVLTRLQHLKGDVMFLQETHLKTPDVRRIKRARMSHVFHLKFADKVRGAAIIIHKRVMFEPRNVILDTDGRYVIVLGILQSIPVVLVSVYAPTWDDDQFFTRLFAKIPDADSHRIIMGGDFNLVQNVILDRSSPTQTTLSKSATVVKSFASQLGITDPWRFKNPHSRAFSFFSMFTTHWIDFFLLDNNLLDKVNACEYYSITTSDHAPTTVDISFPRDITPPARWRFSSQLLSDNKFKDFVAAQIRSYIEFNDTPDVSSNVLWEALKATIRGQAISYISQAGGNYRRTSET